MEVVSKLTSNGLNATVVRQFVPTRIEREVLAQVFAVVCGGPFEEWDARCQVNIPECPIEGEDHRTEALAPGRRAA